MDNEIKVLPFGNNVLIRPRQKKQVLVSDQGTLTEYGDVVAVGDEVQKVKVGDVLGFVIWGVQGLDIGDKKFYLIPEKSEFILAKLENV